MAEGLSFHKIAPSPILRPFVECFWVLDSPGSGSHVVFPDGGIDLCVRWERSEKTTYVSGMALKSRIESISDVTHICGARFNPARGASLFGIGGSDAIASTISLDELSKKGRERFAEGVAEGSSPRECLRNMAAFLASHLPDFPSADPVVGRASSFIEARRGALRISELEDLGLGGRRLRRRFDRALGVAPKTYCRILRFSHAVDLARCSKNRDWADLAVSAGYYDQSHFIQDFLELSGSTPDKHFAEIGPVRFFQYAGLDSF